MIRNRTILVGLVVVVGMMTACAQPTPSASPASPAPSSAASSQPAVQPTTIAIGYTDEYLLFEGDDRKLGLMTKEGKEILPASYTEISISAEGLIFTCETQDPSVRSVYRMFDLDGKQIGQDYSFIESVSPGSDGILIYRQASSTNMAAVPPYAAHTEDASGKRSYWLLDEKGQPYEDAPYDDIEIYEDYVAMGRDGYIYNRAHDGSITKIGNEVVNSYFDGKYQVKNYYIGTHGVAYSLWKRVDNKPVTEYRLLAPPQYSHIYVPFPDRYILTEGSPQYLGGEQYFLYAEDGTLLADNSNYLGYTIEQDGSYVGLSYVGTTYEDNIEKQIMDANGKPEPQGVYFVDKDGKRLSEGYMFVEYYTNEQQLQDNASNSMVVKYYKETGYTRPLPAGDYSKPFYLCLNQQREVAYRAHTDMLLKP